jgi:hypothetical protein
LWADEVRNLIRGVDVVLAIIDMESWVGALAEIALAYGLGKPVYGVEVGRGAFENWFVREMVEDIGPVLESPTIGEAVDILAKKARDLSPVAKCDRCGRPLTHPESVRSSLGPCWAARSGRDVAGSGGGASW